LIPVRAIVVGAGRVSGPSVSVSVANCSRRFFAGASFSRVVMIKLLFVAVVVVVVAIILGCCCLFANRVKSTQEQSSRVTLPK